MATAGETPHCPQRAVNSIRNRFAVWLIGLEATGGEEAGGVKAGICLAQDGKPIIGKAFLVLLAGQGFDCLRNLFEVLSGHWLAGLLVSG